VHEEGVEFSGGELGVDGALEMRRLKENFVEPSEDLNILLISFNVLMTIF
jgi:hypothetical protein